MLRCQRTTRASVVQSGCSLVQHNVAAAGGKIIKIQRFLDQKRTFGTENGVLDPSEPLLPEQNQVVVGVSVVAELFAKFREVLRQDFFVNWPGVSFGHPAPPFPASTSTNRTSRGFSQKSCPRSSRNSTSGCVRDRRTPCTRFWSGSKCFWTSTNPLESVQSPKYVAFSTKNVVFDRIPKRCVFHEATTWFSRCLNPRLLHSLRELAGRLSLSEGQQALHPRRRHEDLILEGTRAALPWADGSGAAP